MSVRSLRTRLLMITALTLFIGLGLLVTAGNLLLARTVASDERHELAARLDAQVAALSVSHGRVQVRDTLDDQSLDAYAWIYAGARLLEQPAHDSAALDAAAAALVDRTGLTMSASSGDILLASRPVRSASGRQVGTVVAGVDVTQLESLREDVLAASVALALIVLLGGTATIYRVLAAALAPVDHMTRAAEDWEAHDLDRRFNLGPAQDEITGLAATLDHLLARIARSRRSEQRFAADVAHELRTPLAAIRGVAELAVGADSEDAQRALADVISHSDRLAATLDTLIAFSRNETAPAAGGVDLADVVTGFGDVSVSTPAGQIPRVEGDPALIRQVFAPVIANALRHAHSEVRVELSAGASGVRAVVRDDGPGVAPELGVKVFLPGVRDDAGGEDGAGLGLPLAQRLARSCGGQVQLGQGPGGCFVIILPATPTRGQGPR